jgi:hypothetical protein
MMSDVTEVELLRVRDLAKYGNPDGPTFEFMVEQLQNAGLLEDDIYGTIISAAYRTNEGATSRSVCIVRGKIMATAVKEYLDINIVWRKNSDSDYPFAAIIDGEQCLIRLNDFPEEHLYTLLVEGRVVANFDDWPATWVKTEGKTLTASAEVVA